VLAFLVGFGCIRNPYRWRFYFGRENQLFAFRIQFFGLSAWPPTRNERRNPLARLAGDEWRTTRGSPSSCVKAQVKTAYEVSAWLVSAYPRTFGRLVCRRVRKESPHHHDCLGFGADSSPSCEAKDPPDPPSPSPATTVWKRWAVRLTLSWRLETRIKTRNEYANRKLGAGDIGGTLARHFTKLGHLADYKSSIIAFINSLARFFN
jgi:hypothetical protein